jgi:hypothetical protein
MGVLVAVGGTLVLVAVGGIGVGVLVGTRVAVFGGRGIDVLVAISRGRRVRVGKIFVGTRVDVLVSSGGTGVSELVLVGMSVSVGTKAVTTCSVSAAAVSRLETARSMRFNGMSVAET